jgi:3-oxoacyl-[acyl-carrier protein] reductase
MIVITGASDGLGLQVARLYKEAGKKVVNISRRECEYADVNICRSLSESENIKLTAKEIEGLSEPMEALINCAGVFSRQSLGEITGDEVSRLMATNIESMILLVSEMYAKIIRDESDIVNVSSTAGLGGYRSEAVYGASKWAVRGFSKNLQEEFNGKPNRVISFCPGGFKTKLFEKATGINFLHDESWMSTEAVALALKQTLDLPKNVEISEIILNRKKLS